MTRTYDRSDLVRVFLAGQRQGFGGYYLESEAFNQALERHYQSVLGGLETLYGLRLSPDGVGSFANKVIFTLFRTTAQSFLAIRTPWSGVIEAGLIDQKLEDAGPAGERVLAASSRIFDLAEDARRTHLEMLDAWCRYCSVNEPT